MKSIVQSFSLFICICIIPLYGEPNNVSKERPKDYTGKWKTVLPNGNESQSEFVNGVAHGKNFIWNKQGQLVREGYYLNGKGHGAWIWYDTDGEIQFIRISEKGIICREIHYSDGKIIADGQYKDGKCWNGIFRAWHYKNGQKVIYHEVREGEAWNGKFWLPLLDNTFHKDSIPTPPEYLNITGPSMGMEYGGVVEPFDPKRGIPRQVTFKEGKIVEDKLERKRPAVNPPEKKRFDVGWPINKSGEWLLEDMYKIDYAIDQLKDYVEHPAYEDMRGKTIKLAKTFARFRLPYPKACEFLIESNVLKDGMTLEETRFLGWPTSHEDGFVRWYYNPDGLHVAPSLTAEVRDDKLYNWVTD